MAKKLPANQGAARRKKAAAPSPSAPAGADDLAVINPDVTDSIAGRTITMREYGHIEGLQLRPMMVDFTRSLEQLIVEAKEAKNELLFEDIFDIAGPHVNAVRFAMAQSMAPAGAQASPADVDWINGLNAQDGERAMEAWWTACGPFFLRRVTKRMGERSWRATRFGGQSSTTPSLTPGTASPASSRATPSASSASTSSG